MADDPTSAMQFGTHQKMTLDAEMLRVLSGNMESLLSGEDHGANGDDLQTDGQVAISVHVPAPRPGMSRFLGVTSNGNTALHLVASRGHLALVNRICEVAPSLVATRNKCLDTPLHCAAKSGHREVVKALLSKAKAGPEVEKLAVQARNQAGATALYEAVRHGHAGVVDLLMEEAPDLASVDTSDEDGVSPLYLAAMTGSAEMAQALLRRSRAASPASSSGSEGRTALHVAAMVSKDLPLTLTRPPSPAVKLANLQAEIAQAILSWEQGPALLTRGDSSGSTPLHFAVLYGKLDIVKLFLDDHAPLDLATISDNKGSYPLHTAAMVGETRIIAELSDKCPNYYELVDDKGRNLLHRAVEHGQERVVRFVCQKSMFAMLLNATDSEGNTPLHLAVEYGYPRIVSLLLATTRVEMGITNKDGLTARDLAHRARARSQTTYFLDPRVIVVNCLKWSRAPITLNGVHHQHAPADAEASAEQDNLVEVETRTIASVLIATVAFAAAFTVPGGFVADDDHARKGTAVLARRFAFRAFVVSNTMAFFCSIIATCFFIYGGARRIPRNHRRCYNKLAARLLPIGTQFTIATFAFGFHLVLGVANRWLMVFVYTLSLASVVFCFPGIWAPLHLGLGKAIWRRAGWRGLVNIHKRPSSLLKFWDLFSTSFLFENIRRPLFPVLLSAVFIVAIVLSISLPDY